jgi:cobalt-zinc-cadmium efflux system protein
MHFHQSGSSQAENADDHGHHGPDHANTVHIGHHHHHHHSGKGIKTAFFLNLSFSIIEIIGGVLTNSVAILSDAVHDLGDAAAIGLAWIFENYSQKGSNKSYTYGYGRLSIVSALITSVILLSGSIFIIVEAVPRLINPESVQVEGMVLMAILGVIVNGAAVLNLKKNESSSLNQKAILLHLMEDVLGWVAVLAGSIIMYFTEWQIIDPILSLGISVYILFNVYKMLKSIFKVFLQATPDNINISDLENKLKNLPDINSVHDLHIWTLDNEYHILTLHLVVVEEVTIDQIEKIKQDARDILSKEGIKHATIEIETTSENCEHEDCV